MLNLQISPVTFEFARIWHQHESMLERFVTDVTHLSAYPQAFTASPSFATAHTPWYLDYGHLTFWFFFFATGVIVLWLAYMFVGLSRNVEARRVVRETRGFSRAQTGDTMTAVLPLTWSVTMLAHAGTHSSNFDENTNATVFSFTVIAYQWGWNYYFPREIAELLSGAPKLVGRGQLVSGQTRDPYALLLAQARRDYLAQLTSLGRYTARHGRYSAASVLQLLLPAAGEQLPAWAASGVDVSAVTVEDRGEGGLLVGQRSAGQLSQAELQLCLVQRRQRSQLRAPLVAQAALMGTAEAPLGAGVATQLLPYGLAELGLPAAPSVVVAQGVRPAVSCAWVGNRLARVHTALATGQTRLTEGGRNSGVALMVQRLLLADAASALHRAPVSLVLPTLGVITPANVGPVTQPVQAPVVQPWSFAARNWWAAGVRLADERAGLAAPQLGGAAVASLRVAPMATWQGGLRAGSALSLLGGSEATLGGADRWANLGGAAAAAADLEAVGGVHVLRELGTASWLAHAPRRHVTQAWPVAGQLARRVCVPVQVGERTTAMLPEGVVARALACEARLGESAAAEVTQGGAYVQAPRRVQGGATGRFGRQRLWAAEERLAQLLAVTELGLRDRGVVTRRSAVSGGWKARQTWSWWELKFVLPLKALWHEYVGTESTLEVVLQREARVWLARLIYLLDQVSPGYEVRSVLLGINARPLRQWSVAGHQLWNEWQPVILASDIGDASRVVLARVLQLLERGTGAQFMTPQMEALRAQVQAQLWAYAVELGWVGNEHFAGEQAAVVEVLTWAAVGANWLWAATPLMWVERFEAFEAFVWAELRGLMQVLYPSPATFSERLQWYLRLASGHIYVADPAFRRCLGRWLYRLAALAQGSEWHVRVLLGTPGQPWHQALTTWDWAPLFGLDTEHLDVEPLVDDAVVEPSRPEGQVYVQGCLTPTVCTPVRSNPTLRGVGQWVQVGAPRNVLAPVEESAWVEGPAETQPTRVAAVVEGDVAQVNARGESPILADVAAQEPTLRAWRSLWTWQTMVAGYPWDRNFRASLARRPAAGAALTLSWLPMALATDTASLALQRQRFDKAASVALTPRVERLVPKAWPVETGRAVLDAERGSVVPVWAVILPLPYLDVDPTFVHTRWSAEVNTSRRSDHDARFRVMWGPLAAAWAAHAASGSTAGAWGRVSGPAVAGGLGARVQRDLAILAQGELGAVVATGVTGGVMAARSPLAVWGGVSAQVGSPQAMGATTTRVYTPTAAAHRIAAHLGQRAGVVGGARVSCGSWATIWAYRGAHARLGGQGGLTGGQDVTQYWLIRLLGQLELFNAEVQLQAYRAGAAHTLAVHLVPATEHPVVRLLAAAGAAVESLKAPARAAASYTPRAGYVAIDSEVSSQRRLRVTKGIYLPADVPMHGIFGSKDVIHSWAIPGLGVKIDCIPGYSSHRRLVLRWRGLYWGQCMEVCGRYHHWMPILVRVVHKDVFLLWCLAYLRLIVLRAASEALTPSVSLARDVWAVASQAQASGLPATVWALPLE